MKEKIRNGLKRNKGITLIALIITIIVLLILAGVTISLTLGNNGIFKTATNAVEEHIIAEQKEELERAILNIKMNKIAQGKTIQISDLNELNNDTFYVEDTSAFPVVVKSTKYEFQIDDKYVVTYIGPANGLRVTYTLSTKEWTKDGVIITINATSEKGTIGEIGTPAGLTKNADGTYTASENGTYKFIVKDNLNNQKEIEAKINNIDRTAPTLSDASVEAFGMNLKIKVTATDSKSGVDKIYYSITPNTVDSTTPATGTLTSGVEKEIKTTEEGEYTVTFTAKDKLENTTPEGQEVTKKATTFSVILNYPIITANGVMNCRSEDGNYCLDTSVQPTAADACPVECYDGDESTELAENKEIYLNVSPSAWGKKLIVKGELNLVIMFKDESNEYIRVIKPNNVTYEVSNRYRYSWYPGNLKEAYVVIPDGATRVEFTWITGGTREIKEITVEDYHDRNLNAANIRSYSADAWEDGCGPENALDYYMGTGHYCNWNGGTRLLVEYNSLSTIKAVGVYSTENWGYSFRGAPATIYYSEDDSLTLESDLSGYSFITVETEKEVELEEPIKAKRVMLIKEAKHAIYEFMCFDTVD